MERAVNKLINDKAGTSGGVKQITNEVQHDLLVTHSITRRKRSFLIFMITVSLATLVIAVAGGLEILELTPGVFTIVIVQFAVLFALGDFVRGVHIDTLKARLIHPAFYTPDGRYYKRILSHEAIMREFENNVKLSEAEKEETK